MLLVLLTLFACKTPNEDTSALSDSADTTETNDTVDTTDTSEVPLDCSQAFPDVEYTHCSSLGSECDDGGHKEQCCDDTNQFCVFVTKDAEGNIEEGMPQNSECRTDENFDRLDCACHDNLCN